MPRKIAKSDVFDSEEPSSIQAAAPTYRIDLMKALNWYSREKEKKDARVYLKAYTKSKIFDQCTDQQIQTTMGWLARIITKGGTLTANDHNRLQSYIDTVKAASTATTEKVEEKARAEGPSVRDHMNEKIREYLGTLEGELDNIYREGKSSFSLYEDLRGKAIPQPYCGAIDAWLKRKASEYVFVYETSEEDIKEGYSNFSKRTLSTLVECIAQWIEDISRYAQFKKANRKPRVRKVKSPAQQIAKLKFKKEDTELGIKSVPPATIVGASQVWIYNTKYKKLSVYRTDSSAGILIKGTTLQNYDPDQCEQKSLRKPAETLKKVLEAGKVQLRKLVQDLSTKDQTVNGRINGDCLIVRVVK